MNHTWGTPETEPPETPEPPEPVSFHAAHFWLLVGVVAIVVSIVAALADWQLESVTVARGVFAILAALSVGGFSGWMVMSAEVRNRHGLGVILRGMCHRQREVLDQVAELTTAVEVLAREVEKLRGEAGQAHVTHLPKQGARHLSAAVGGQGDTVPVQPGSGLDAETIAAARKVARRLADAPD